MHWPEDAAGWPLTEFSRHILVKPHRWHVQEAGEGDLLFLIHGAGGATQSWRGLFPLLTETHRVIAVDLPGQGFTGLGARQRCGLDHMAEDLLSLMKSQGWKPKALIGHSAGAALALRLALMGGTPHGQVIGINAALDNFKGVAGWLFPAMAKMLSLNPFSANFVIATTTRATVERLIQGTGSHIDADGIDLYHRLATDWTHVDGTLAMMAQWSLDGLRARLGEVEVPVTLIAGDRDRAVPVEISVEAAEILENATVVEEARLGHLMHEEDPALVARHIRIALSKV